MTLGLAIRMSQSIGLHVEDSQSFTSANGYEKLLELRRRTWHSVYVLDRLLSLQLGRPTGIRNADCNVQLPSRLGDEAFEMGGEITHSNDAIEPKTGDYFIAVIKFSEIVGHVIRDVYRPTAKAHSEAMLDQTDAMDSRLLSWQNQLPRWLR